MEIHPDEAAQLYQEMLDQVHTACAKKYRLNEGDGKDDGNGASEEP